MIVPQLSPGFSNGIPAGQTTSAHLLLTDKDGKVTGANSQWLNAKTVTVTVDGPVGPVDAKMSLTQDGTTTISYTPVVAGTHTLSIFQSGNMFLKKEVSVTDGRPPQMESAHFTRDWATVRVVFDKEISTGRGWIDCGKILSRGTLRKLGGGSASSPPCSSSSVGL